MNRTKLKLLISDVDNALTNLKLFVSTEDKYNDAASYRNVNTKIFNKIKSKGKQGMQRIKLNNFARRTLGLNASQKYEIIDSLVENNLIKIIDDIYFVVK